VFLNEPPKSHYDFSFNLFGFPVRVHPGFFILPLVFGAGAAGQASNPGVLILIFAMVFFVSILVHELGHAFALRFFGVPSRVVLYWMGGLAIHESGGWGGQTSINPDKQIVVSLAGPFAGFALAAITVGIIFALGGDVQFGWQGLFPQAVPDLSETSLAGNESMFHLFWITLFCNIVWGVLNLAPVLPLDGGRVCEQLCIKSNYQTGLRTALMISVVAAAIIALAGFAFKDNFIGIFFAIMGISAWMTLQQMMGRSQGRW